MIDLKRILKQLPKPKETKPTITKIEVQQRGLATGQVVFVRRGKP